MIRNLKVLGLALMAVFAFSALSASAASAQTTDGEITVAEEANGIAAEIAGLPHKLTALGHEVECPGTTYHIRKYNVTPHEPVPTGGVTTVTVKPTYSSTCIAEGSLKMTIKPNNCDYVLHIGETVTANTTYSVTEDIECNNAGEAVEFEVFASASNENTRTCTLKATPQTGLSGPVLENGTDSVTGKMDVTLTGTFTNIHLEQTGLCGSKTTTTAEFHTNVTITAKNTLNQPIDMTITH